jgi:hypothetical protein
MAQRGGKRPGAGRPTRTVVAARPPKAEREDIRAYARKYGPEAIDFLVKTMRSEKVSCNARVVAADRLLDRGYGRPHQATEEPDSKTIEGIVIEPLRKYNGNGSDEPVRLEDFRNLK